MDKPDNAIAYQEASIDIAAAPDAVYAVVSDLGRGGEWSPESTGGAWKDGGTGNVGDWFVGENRNESFEWTRDVEVVGAERGRDFTFVVGGAELNRTTWSYEMSPTGTGTTLTEKWWIVNKPPVWLKRTEEELQDRSAFTLESIRQTLAGIKIAVEAS